MVCSNSAATLLMGIMQCVANEDVCVRDLSTAHTLVIVSACRWLLLPLYPGRRMPHQHSSSPRQPRRTRRRFVQHVLILMANELIESQLRRLKKKARAGASAQNDREHDADNESDDDDKVQIEYER